MKELSILSISHSIFLPPPPTFGKFHVVILPGRDVGLGQWEEREPVRGEERGKER